MRQISIVSVFLVLAVAAMGQAKHPFLYADNFQAEESLKNPVRIPAQVLPRAFRDRSAPDQSLEDFRRKVTGTYIDLDENRLKDFLVQGDLGANITGYWLFRNVSGRQQLVFHTRALGVSLLGSIHEGTRDVESAAATAIAITSVIYHFDGKNYRPYRCWTENLGEEPTRRKMMFFRCHG